MGATGRPKNSVATNAGFRHYTYYRSAILVLLKEHESHGYELVNRLADMGFDTRVAASMYSVLRDMEDDGLVTSSWDLSQGGGPPRRVYRCTVEGDVYLRGTVPTLVRQRQALGMMIDRFGALTQLERRRQGTDRRVLVIDDDQETRHTLWAMLVDRGWVAEELDDAEAVLAAVPGRALGIVVVGDRVNGIAGIEVARRFRDRGFEGLLVVYSAAIDDDLEMQGARLNLQLLPKAKFNGLIDLLAAQP